MNTLVALQGNGEGRDGEELRNNNHPSVIDLSNDHHVSADRALHLVPAAQPRTLSSALAMPRRVLTLFLFAMPFLAVASIARDLGLLSNDHSLLLTQALSLHQFPALSSLDFGQPPLLTLMLSVWPNPVLVQYLSALFGGAVAYALWSQLRTTNLPTWMNAALVLSFCATPAVLLVAGMRASDMLALLLLLLAWRSYTKFVHHAVTWHGFVAGLLLGLAFFASFLTILFVIPFALGAPSYLQSHSSQSLGGKTDRTHRDRSRAVVAGIVVIAFPGLCALSSWLYLAWLGTGDLLHFPGRIVGAGLADHQIPSFAELLKQTAGDLLRQPLYVVVGVLMARRGKRQFIAHLFPLALVTVPRAFGWHYDEGFVAACYLGFAVLGLAVMTSERPGIPAAHVSHSLLGVLAAAVVAQLAVSATLPLQTAEPEHWRTALIGTSGDAKSESDAQDAFAARLATQPQGVILADDAAAPLIARSGTVTPFLLPMSDQFQPGIWNPDHVVDHILMPTVPNPNAESRITDLVVNGTIEGFHLDTRQDGWTLYTCNGMPNLIGPPTA